MGRIGLHFDTFLLYAVHGHRVITDAHLFHVYTTAGNTFVLFSVCRCSQTYVVELSSDVSCWSQQSSPHRSSFTSTCGEGTDPALLSNCQESDFSDNLSF